VTILRLGTRASRLALIQSRSAADLLSAANPGLTVELVEIATAGDRDKMSSLAGGQGWFTTALQEALLGREVDFAVHSFKDLPTVRPEGLVIAAVPERADPRDALVTTTGRSLAQLVPGTVVGTSSPRREAQLRAARSDLEFRPIRGNVDTRLAKVKSGEFGATVLALAGLRRMGLEDEAAQVFEPAEMLPAPAQGALALECRSNDERSRSLLAAIDDPEIRAPVETERSFLATLGAGCQFPAGAYAVLSRGELTLQALVAPDGRVRRGTERAGVASAIALGKRMAIRLMTEAGLPVSEPGAN